MRSTSVFERMVQELVRVENMGEGAAREKIERGEREMALMDLSLTHQIFSHGYICEKSFARRHKRNPNIKNTGLIKSEEVLKRLTKEILGVLFLS